MAALTFPDCGRAGVLLQVLRDRRLWLAAAGLTLALALFAAWPRSGPAPESPGSSLAGQAQALKAQDPALYAVFAGALPALNKDRTVGQAFADYAWFAEAPKWSVLAPGTGAQVLVTAPLKAVGATARFGLGGAQGRAVFSVEFALSADSRSFHPTASAVELRDASNRLLSVTRDRDFVLLRRVLVGQEPGLGLTLTVEGSGERR